MMISQMFSTLLELDLNHYLLLSSTVLLFYYFISRETRNVPPGPTGLPVVGYIPFLENLTAHEQLWKLSLKYGSIFRVNDHKSAHELVSLEATHARPVPNIFALSFGHDDHLLSWRGPVWKEHRKFALKALRTVGVGKPEMESLIISEISYMLDQIEKDSQGGACAVNVDNYLTPSTSNVVNAVITGKRFDYDHPIRIKQDVVFKNSPENVDVPFFWTGYAVNFITVIKILALIPSKMSKMFDDANEVMIQYLTKETAAEMKVENNVADANIIAAYISEIKQKAAKGEKTHLDIDRLPGLGSALLGAGSGTVRDALEWAFLYCAYYPHIQDKLASELEQVIGFDRKPAYGDRTKMPYTQAFIWETMRHATTVPLNLPHIALEDVHSNGFTIPRGYHILVNTWAIHNDPNYWDKPQEFRVERFLTPEGDKLVKHEALMPFSTGRRSCPGEPLAQVELFIYLTMTLQRFKIQGPPGVKLTLESVAAGFFIIPKHLHLQFTKR